MYIICVCDIDISSTYTPPILTPTTYLQCDNACSALPWSQNKEARFTCGVGNWGSILTAITRQCIASLTRPDSLRAHPRLLYG